MQYVAAYALLTLGGIQQPTLNDIKSLFSEIQQECDDYQIELMVYSLKGKQLQDIIKEGLLILKDNQYNGQEMIKKQLRLQKEFQLHQKMEEEKKIKLQEEQERLRQKQIEEQRRKEEEERLRQKQIEEQRRKEEEERLRQKQIEEQRRKEEEERLRQKQIEEQRRKEEEERLRQKQLEEQKRRKQEEIQKLKSVEEYQYLQDLQRKDLKLLESQKNLSEMLKSQNYVKQISILQEEVEKINQNGQVSKKYQTYQIAKCEQKQLQILKENNQTRLLTPIYHMKQNIEVSNQEVLLHVISESLRRDQNRELLILPKSSKTGLDSILFQDCDDQECLSFRTTQADFEEINNDLQKKTQFILDFKLKVSASLNIPFEDIEILDFVKGSIDVRFTMKSKRELNSKELQVLENYCGGKIEFYNYFSCGNNNEKENLVGLSPDDFQPQYNMHWGTNFQEKEQRGPRSHRYDYYFPRGFYGYALNVLHKYGETSWIQMDGNDKEWRILYHGTHKDFMKNIVNHGLSFNKDRIKHGQFYHDKICQFSKKMVGYGVYFTNQISIAEGYSKETQIGPKKFKLVFQSRVNPDAIRQSEEMKRINYFVVNEAADIRPYRILLKEV